MCAEAYTPDGGCRICVAVKDGPLVSGEKYDVIKWNITQLHCVIGKISLKSYLITGKDGLSRFIHPHVHKD